MFLYVYDDDGIFHTTAHTNYKENITYITYVQT